MTIRQSIFISYRRHDTGDQVDWLSRELREHFGADRVFVDEGILPGEEWATRIELELERAAVVLVVIGKRWWTDEIGKPRATSDDWVYREVRYALDSHLPIVPVLADGVSDIPQSPFGKELADYQIFKLALHREELAGLFDAISIHVTRRRRQAHEVATHLRDIIAYARSLATLSQTDKAPFLLALSGQPERKQESVRDRRRRKRKKPNQTASSTLKVHLADDSDANPEFEIRTIPEICAQCDRVILLGEAGSGKTASLCQLAITAATEALDDPDSIIPVWIELRDWPEDSTNFKQVFEQRLHQKALRPESSQSFLVLLDGLDELEEARPSSFDAYLASLNDWMNRTRRVRVVVSSRRDTLISKKLNARAFVLQPLSESQIEEIARSTEGGNHLLEAVGWEQKGESRADKRHLSHLLKSPLNLGMMCILFQADALDVPESRSALFRRFTREIHKRDQEYRNGKPIEYAALIDGLGYLGLTRFFKRVASPLKLLLGEADKQAIRDAEVVATRCRLLRVGFPVNGPPGASEFAHPLLRDHLVAEYLLERRELLAQCLQTLTRAGSFKHVLLSVAEMGARDTVVKALATKEPLAAAEIYVQTQPAADEAGDSVDDLVQALVETTNQRGEATKWVRKIGAPALTTLERLVRGALAWRMRPALAMLGQMPLPVAKRILVQFLSRPCRRHERKEALRALCNGADDQREALFELARRDLRVTLTTAQLRNFLQLMATADPDLCAHLCEEIGEPLPTSLIVHEPPDMPSQVEDSALPPLETPATPKKPPMAPRIVNTPKPSSANYPLARRVPTSTQTNPTPATVSTVRTSNFRRPSVSITAALPNPEPNKASSLQPGETPESRARAWLQARTSARGRAMRVQECVLIRELLHHSFDEGVWVQCWTALWGVWSTDSALRDLGKRWLWVGNWETLNWRQVWSSLARNPDWELELVGFDWLKHVSRENPYWYANWRDMIRMLDLTAPLEDVAIQWLGEAPKHRSWASTWMRLWEDSDLDPNWLADAALGWLRNGDKSHPDWSEVWICVWSRERDRPALTGLGIDWLAAVPPGHPGWVRVFCTLFEQSGTRTLALRASEPMSASIDALLGASWRWLREASDESPAWPRVWEVLLTNEPSNLELYERGVRWLSRPAVAPRQWREVWSSLMRHATDSESRRGLVTTIREWLRGPAPHHMRFRAWDGALRLAPFDDDLAADGLRLLAELEMASAQWPGNWRILWDQGVDRPALTVSAVAWLQRREFATAEWPKLWRALWRSLPEVPTVESSVLCQTLNLVAVEWLEATPGAARWGSVWVRLCRKLDSPDTLRKQGRQWLTATTCDTSWWNVWLHLCTFGVDELLRTQGTRLLVREHRGWRKQIAAEILQRGRLEISLDLLRILATSHPFWSWVWLELWRTVGAGSLRQPLVPLGTHWLRTEKTPQHWAAIFFRLWSVEALRPELASAGESWLSTGLRSPRVTEVASTLRMYRADAANPARE